MRSRIKSLFGLKITLYINIISLSQITPRTVPHSLLKLIAQLSKQYDTPTAVAD